MPVSTTMPVTVMPLHLLRFDVADFVASGDGGMGIRAGRPPRVLAQWHHRRSLCRGCGEGRRACGSTQRNLQKVAAFHEHCPFLG
jgi:hypothetical protein